MIETRLWPRVMSDVWGVFVCVCVFGGGGGVKRISCVNNEIEERYSVTLYKLYKMCTTEMGKKKARAPVLKSYQYTFFFECTLNDFTEITESKICIIMLSVAILFCSCGACRIVYNELDLLEF